MTEKSLDEMIAQRKKQMDELRREIGLLMTRDKLYRESYLTLDKLAKRMGVSRRLLSETLNNEAEKGFSRYVNSFRVKEVIRELILHRDTRIDLEAVRENAGFGTRSAFYEHFKHITGLSPAEFHKGKIKDSE